MFKNYFKIAWRNLWKKKLFSFINIIGLTLGLAFAGIIGIYVYKNLEVDKQQPGNLYRVITDYTSKTVDDKTNSVGRALVPAIREIPEVEAVIPMQEASFKVKKDNDYFFDKIAFAGDQFLAAFNFPLLNGDKNTALKDPYSVVLTAPTAKKYFGTTNVIGKTLLLNDTLPFTITGVLQALPSSHMDFDILVSFSTWQKMGNNINIWFTWDMTCYVTLKKEAKWQDAEAKIAGLSMKYNGEEYRNNGYEIKHKLEPVWDIYLHSTLSGFNKPSGSAKQLYIFSIIGVALLVLACINFINLTTALQAERSKEIGVRKTIGASVTSLIAQFMIETFMMVLIAAILAIFAIALLLPFVEKISGQPFSINELLTPAISLGAILLIIITTVCAGWYPSLLLSRLQPTSSIKKTAGDKRGRFSLRKMLVVFQFTVSLVLIIGTLISVKQLAYMHNKELGFNKETIAVISLSNTPRGDMDDNYESLKNQISQIPGVSAVAASAGLPGKYGWNGQIVQPEGLSKDKSVTMEVIPSDLDYVKTLGITMKAGRDFSKSFTTDATNGVLINEAACKLIGWKPEEAIGKMIHTSGMDSGFVIGVMNDYHQHGLQQAINPIMIFKAPYAYNYLAISIKGSGLKNIINNLESLWKNRFPGYAFKFSMLDDDLDMQYKEENKLTSVITLFSLLTIFTAVLGLFGLTTFVVVQRKKEIGIRKILGASITSIIGIVSKEFLLLILVAFIIASPLAWWIMNAWLQDFSYRTNIDIWVFIGAGLMALILAGIIVSSLAARAAWANPVKSLRTE